MKRGDEMTDELPHVFAGLRFLGDTLDPQEIRAILDIEPRSARKKGEMIPRREGAGDLRSHTGIWYVATDAFTGSQELSDHVAILQRLLRPGGPKDNKTLIKLRDVLERSGAKAEFSIFWYGRDGDTPPDIPGSIALLASAILAEIDPDYYLEGIGVDCDPENNERGDGDA